MNETVYRQTENAVRGRTPLVAALELGSLFETVNQAAAQGVTPTHPGPHNATRRKHGFPVGPRGWYPGLRLPAYGPGRFHCISTVNAHPEATLFTSFFGQDVQIITHFLSASVNFHL